MQMAAELRILQEQQQQLALAVAGVAQSMAEGFNGLNGRLDTLENNIRKVLADLGTEIKNTATDVRGMNERSRETITRLGELKEEVEGLRRALVALASRPMTAAPADPLDPDAPPPPVSQVPSGGVQLPPALAASARRLFDLGYADYASGNYPSAIRTWEELLATSPDSEWADDAQAYIGEAEYNQRRFEQAIDAYNRVIQNYPRGDQVPTAYYRLGMAHENLQRYDSARAAWQQLIKLFPDTVEAGLAKQGLGRIEKLGGR